MSVCERWSLPQGHPRSLLNCPGSKSHSTPQAAGQRARPASPALTHHPPTLPCRWRELGVAAVSPFPVSSRPHPRPPVCHACALSVAGLPLTGGQRERQGQHVYAAGLHVQGRAKGLARLLRGRPAAAAAHARPVPHLAPGRGWREAGGGAVPPPPLPADAWSPASTPESSGWWPAFPCRFCPSCVCTPGRCQLLLGVLGKAMGHQGAYCPLWPRQLGLWHEPQVRPQDPSWWSWRRLGGVPPDAFHHACRLPCFGCLGSQCWPCRPPRGPGCCRVSG